MVEIAHKYTFVSFTPSRSGSKYVEYNSWYDAVNHASQHNVERPYDRAVVFDNDGKIVLQMRVIL